jgi:sulfane dehydrogenase subunit SoxC
MLPGRIVRLAEPRNEELDLRCLTSFLTPNEHFYIRCHGPEPSPAPGWRLTIDGLVRRPLSLGIDDVRAMPQVEAAVTLECAGNRRTLQQPRPGGVPWAEGAVSTARWGGVPLEALLGIAGATAGAVHVRLIGGDRCETAVGMVPFARSMPLDAVRRSGALLALTMNGAPLPQVHGAPARIIVPSRYAMDSVKWLSTITLSAEPESGPYQVDDYRLWYDERGPGEEIGPIRVASVIASPRPETVVEAGQVRVAGAAWTGTGTIAMVEVSTDDGASWTTARLVSPALAGAWRLWEYDWDAAPGTHVLRARAHNSAGHAQPDSLRANRKGYAGNFVVPVLVAVR